MKKKVLAVVVLIVGFIVALFQFYGGGTSYSDPIGVSIYEPFPFFSITYDGVFFAFFIGEFLRQPFGFIMIIGLILLIISFAGDK